jgi:hypothetical protein
MAIGRALVIFWVRRLLLCRFFEKFGMKQKFLCLLCASLWVSYMTLSSTSKMEEKCSSETSINFQRTTWRYIREDRGVHNHRCDSLKSYHI